MRKILAVLVLFSIHANTYAATIYRHVPFDITINTGDTLTVNYDFSEKSGIRCTSDSRALKVDFAYKGRAKNARLPVTLQAAHIPVEADEELANAAGQFSISTLQTSAVIHSYGVSCNYLD